ncbi:glycosyltransferase involved in cell wall biosynthesis [Neobacillus niacini]|uniref:glycosyltransferase family 2 protein n=1 Tax=Neobacillus niacini TaxID=86668 RepID=UPI00285DAA19|nr:glycosyltransferase family A protein [Neobacillus niacini]MDR7079144.1 glycosyltransferase involved in cell wall biosynthesis [Neobacillus niacini]
MPTLTVFTPTYNRAYTLHNCYESLKRQTSKDFMWLVIDDGSTDDTKSLVKKWIMESDDFEIKYIYKDNGGMHTAHNVAYEHTTTELCMCIDSDDYLADEAVEIIVNHWSEFGDDCYAGMVGLDSFIDGTIVGKSFPKNLKEDKFRNIHRMITGDKKYIFRTEVFNSYPPYPIFVGERLTPLSMKYFLIDNKYKMLIINKVLCYVEYMEDGSSKNIIESYKKNPRGFLELRKVSLIMEPGFKRKFLSAAQYVMGNIMIRNKSFIKESPKKVLTVLALPLGLIMYLYVCNTRRKKLNSSLR